MYLEEIEIENVGPIDKIKHTLKFNESGNPIPLVIVGQNGSGKSILLSHLVNALLSAKDTRYDDLEVETGKAYKLRSPSYIKSKSNYYFTRVKFEQDLELFEWQLNQTRENFEESYKYTPNNSKWQNIGNNQTSHFESNFPNNENLKSIIDNNCLLYFPPNRFEEPGWLNIENLTNQSDFRDLKKVSSISNRKIINYSPLKDNQNWLLDLILDKYALEIQTHNVNVNIGGDGTQPVSLPVFGGFTGEANDIHNEIIVFLKLLFQTDQNLRFGIGKRRSRVVEIVKNNEQWIPNLFNLSTGESILLNIFLSIIKDCDLSKASFTSLSEIRGIVIVDEIDSHLHSNLQYDVLPKLLKLFPKIQFILTTHSPLFLLGLEKDLGSDNFEILDLPAGALITTESFSEFDKAYQYFKESNKFEQDVNSEIISSLKSLVFVEGDYDIRYLERAAQLLDKLDILESLKLIDSDGYGNIDKVWKHFNSKLSEATPQKILLLYDCDTNKSNDTKGNVEKRIIPSIEANPIEKGIENLFTKTTIEKCINEKEAFIDVFSAHTKKVRGNTVEQPETWVVNKNEKGNMCNWLCEHGDLEDFENFRGVFDIIEQSINAT